MKRFFHLLRYLLPYKWRVVQNVLYNVLGAFFALFTFTMVLPFLQVLFKLQELAEKPQTFSLSTDYFLDLLNYYLGTLVETRGSTGALVLVSILVVVFSLLKNGFTFLANYHLAPIRSFVVRDIRNDIYRKVLRLPLTYYTEARKGDVMTRISNDVQEIEISIMSSLSMLFRDPITIVVYMVALFSISLPLTLFVLLVLPLAGLIIGRLGGSLRKTSFKGQERLGELMSQLEETLSGLRIVKAFNGEAKMEAKFMEKNHRFALLMKRVARRRYLASPLSEFLGTIVMMVIMTYGGSLVLSGHAGLSGESLILFLIIFSQILSPAKSLSNAWTLVQKGMASVDRIDQLLLADEKITEKADAVAPLDFRESIEFRNVSFRYDREDVLKEVSFAIKKGETLALVGKSGSGKSTLVDLLPRFMDVASGEILIDGVPVRDFSLKALRRLMGVVSQQSILFNDSFSNNIAFGVDEKPSGSAIEAAARVANAHDFIMENPEAYEASVGEGGNKLSGGQKQRISIARAVLANPPILILDEATSALDTESEKLVQDALIKLMQNRTSIVIAHRLSTIKHADQILVIDEGRIVERGTHQELVAREDGLYHKLHAMQMY
ncbi:MAG: antibiotic ABC transporter ATP-binding protein [Bacteroidetes bacterium]|nr:MAG: antibiotic ABC transporter ATP-binding protein [Bacteroidota bacterium]